MGIFLNLIGLLLSVLGVPFKVQFLTFLTSSPFRIYLLKNKHVEVEIPAPDFVPRAPSPSPTSVLCICYVTQVSFVR